MIKNGATCLAVTAAAHSLFFIGWLVTTKLGESTIRAYITVLEMIADVLLPLFLLLVLFIKKCSPFPAKKLFIAESATCLAAAFFGTSFHYFNWGFCAGNAFSPDFETRLMFISVACINILSVLGAGIVFQVILLFKKS